MTTFFGNDLNLWEACKEWLEYSPHKASKDAILDYLRECLSCEDYTRVLQDNFIALYDIVSVTGYSQGDRVDVVFLHRDQNDYSFKDKKEFLNRMSNHFENLIYRCPAFVRLEIDGGEWDLSEYLEDVYYYEKDQIIERFKQDYNDLNPEYVISWLDGNLPECLNYA